MVTHLQSAGKLSGRDQIHTNVYIHKSMMIIIMTDYNHFFWPYCLPAGSRSLILRHGFIYRRDSVMMVLMFQL